VIAIIALASSLTGTAVASKWISGSQIRPGSITSKQIKNASLTALDLAPGLVIENNVNAPVGPKGDTGAPGANGVTAFDPSKLIVVNGVDVTLASGTRVDSQANCPAGTYAIGGGYSEMQNGGNILVVATSSQPLSNVNSSLQGWDVVARNMGGSGQTTPWHAIAYCAPAA
jgi:hypothetical protein